ncbi:MAG: hypothetical protein OXT07_05635 [bacterium]|nr:hypothetical protein [bacterium]
MSIAAITVFGVVRPARWGGMASHITSRYGDGIFDASRSFDDLFLLG